MKRVWIGALLCAVLLCSCRKAEPEQPPGPERPAKTEQAALPAERAEPDGRSLAEECAAVYRTVIKDLTFLISVEGADGSDTTLDMTPHNAAAAEGLDSAFAAEFRWSEAEEADWSAQTGALVTLADGDSPARVQCRTEGDVVCWRTGGAARYARVTEAGEASPGSHRFSRRLLELAEEELERRAWAQTVENTFAPAGKMAEAVAAYYRALPDWVSRKPLDIQAERVELYDTYEGEPQQLCCHLFFRVKTDSQDALPRQLGDGPRDADEDGYRLRSAAVRLERSAGGAWRVAEKDSGGVYVTLPFDWEEATIEQLAEAFFLSGGETNRRRIPDRMLELPEAELARLPDLLQSRSEMEVKLLCGALGSRVKEGGSRSWTLETLQPVMGAFDIYLDA